MINTKRPGTDDYTQVGFIEAKDDQGNYQNIDHIYDSEGNIVFQQGYLNEYDGADDFGIPAIGKPLIDYAIYGNAFQDGIPTSGNPIMPQGTGERTGNLAPPLLEWINGYVASNGGINPASETYKEKASDYISIDAGKAYTFSMENGFPGGTNYSWRAIGWYAQDKTFISRASSNANVALSTNAPSNAAYCRLSYRTHGETTNPMFNSGSTALSYEPYGYKLDISSGGVNLFDPDILLEAAEWTKDNNTYSGNSSALHSKFNSFDNCIPVNATVVNMDVMFRYANRNTSFFIVFWYTDGTSANFSKNGKAGEWTYLSAESASNKTLKGVAFSYGTNDLIELKEIMLNRGSTALPYSPYNRTTTPVYLGEVETTRKIKKLVLTGEENWNTYQSTYYITVSDYYRMYDIGSHLSVCSHYPNIQVMTLPEMHYCLGGLVDGSTHTAWNGNIVFNPSPMISSLTDWKAYLAAQYAAGTPVTVWYVLATETTGIVNEPLMRISDYADSVDFSQTRVEIPTLKRPNTTVIDITTSLPPSEVYAKYRGSKTQQYDLFLAANGDSIEAKNGQSLYIGDDT